ncbi:Lrp/AsnC family transcriptional regulator [Demetria terragena]|uniref:Lrp/AsnC family transcriptional regulator n=1 Tax=Demetria terragena TaxID=63959 RepID=UPI00035CB98C|nr:Lrp/AsnC family transcriptional regulator [Demetria terragena]
MAEQPHSTRSYRAVDEAPLDDKAKRIIEELQRDGRATYGEIGRAVGLSEAAVRQRVGKLISNGTLQIVAVTNPFQVGFGRIALVGIKVAGEVSAAADAVTALEQVTYVVVTAGNFDIVAEVVCSDDAELVDLLGAVRRIPGVTDTETMPYLALWSQRYNWGTR